MRWNQKCVGVWHDWFAWHPVRVGYQWVWWEFAKRRLDSNYAGNFWEYH